MNCIECSVQLLQMDAQVEVPPPIPHPGKPNTLESSRVDHNRFYRSSAKRIRCESNLCIYEGTQARKENGKNAFLLERAISEIAPDALARNISEQIRRYQLDPTNEFNYFGRRGIYVHFSRSTNNLILNSFPISVRVFISGAVNSAGSICIFMTK